MDQGECPPGFGFVLAKLETSGRLDSEDREALRAICVNIRSVAAHEDIISEGDNPDCVHLMLEGWAARYRILPDGGRQITAFLLPGDYCDAHVAILGHMDHGIVALTNARVAFVPEEQFDSLARRSVKLAHALWWATLVDEAVLRAWIVNIGRRDAHSAVAHLFCELHARLLNIGLVTDHRLELPLTQEVLADALGLTPVHINRVLQRLRAEGLIALKSGVLTIPDARALRRAAGFDAAYLHVRRPAS